MNNGLSQEQNLKIEQLLAQMTLDEKIGQMSQESPSIVGGFEVSFEELIEMMTDGRISKEEFGKIMGSAQQDYHEDEIRKFRDGCDFILMVDKLPELMERAGELK